ncbi:hypothetical protein [Kitasatospora sp. NPDC059327]
MLSEILGNRVSGRTDVHVPLIVPVVAVAMLRRFDLLEATDD